MPKTRSNGTRAQRNAVRKMLKELNLDIGDHLSMNYWDEELDRSFKKFFNCDDNGIPKFLLKKYKPY